MAPTINATTTTSSPIFCPPIDPSPIAPLPWTLQERRSMPATGRENSQNIGIFDLLRFPATFDRERTSCGHRRASTKLSAKSLPVPASVKDSRRSIWPDGWKSHNRSFGLRIGPTAGGYPRTIEDRSSVGCRTANLVRGDRPGLSGTVKGCALSMAGKCRLHVGRERVVGRESSASQRQSANRWKIPLLRARYRINA